jgi:hypothetical protein
MHNDWKRIGSTIPTYKTRVLLAHFGKDDKDIYAIGYLGACRNRADLVDDSYKDNIHVVPATHWQFLRSYRQVK